MVDKVEKSFAYYQRRLDKKIKRQIKIAGSTSRKKGNGGDPPKNTPSPSSSSLSSYSNTSSSSISSDAHKKHSENSDMNTQLLKIDMSIVFPCLKGI